MSDARLLVRQVGHELTQLRRNPVTMILSVGFPLVFFIILTSLFGNETLPNGATFVQYLAPGMASFGVVMATFSFLAVGFADARASGVLRGQAATPLPRWALLGGRIGAAVLLGFTAVVLVLGVGVSAFGLQLYARSFVAVVVTLVLGSLTFAALGLALAGVMPSVQTTLATSVGVVIPLSFISDVFIVGGDLPDGLTRLGWFFPLKHMAVLFGDALNPALTGSGLALDHLAALGAWGVAGALIAAWALRRDGDRVRRRSATRAHPRDAVARSGRPGAVGLLLGETRHTLQLLARDVSSVFFAVALPVLLVLVIPTTVGGGDATMEDGRSVGSLFAATMAVYGAAVTAYLNMPVDLAEARERGVLKRRAGTPQPRVVLLGGRVVGALVVALGTLVAVYVAAVQTYGVQVPPGWPVALGVFVLGVVCFALVGLAVSTLASGPQAAVGLGLGTLLPLAFISDVFVIGVHFPTAIDAIAGFFPLRHAVRAMTEATADGGSVLNPVHLVVLAAWAVAGAAVVAWRFGWEPAAARPRRRGRGPSGGVLAATDDAPSDPTSAGGDGVTAREVHIARLLVTAQFVLIGLVAVLPGSGAWPAPPWLRVLAGAGVAVGVAIMLLGGTALGRGLTAVPIPNRHAVLRTGGLYRVVRHPIYTGLLLTVGSVAVAAASWWRALAFVALVVLITFKARWEEERLARRFAAYPAYAARTPRFVPGMRLRR